MKISFTAKEMTDNVSVEVAMQHNDSYSDNTLWICK